MVDIPLGGEAVSGATSARQRIEAAEGLRKLISVRRMRDQFIPGRWFADPAWDILLHLLCEELDGSEVTMSSLCAASAVPYTTALRLIENMVDAGLIQRQKDPNDKRRTFLGLTEASRSGLRNYFQALKQGQLTGA